MPSCLVAAHHCLSTRPTAYGTEAQPDMGIRLDRKAFSSWGWGGVGGRGLGV